MIAVVIRALGIRYWVAATAALAQTYDLATRDGPNFHWNRIDRDRPDARLPCRLVIHHSQNYVWEDRSHFPQLR